MNGKLYSSLGKLHYLGVWLFTGILVLVVLIQLVSTSPSSNRGSLYQYHPDLFNDDNPNQDILENNNNNKYQDNNKNNNKQPKLMYNDQLCKLHPDLCIYKDNENNYYHLDTSTNTLVTKEDDQEIEIQDKKKQLINDKYRNRKNNRDEEYDDGIDDDRFISNKRYLYEMVIIAFTFIISGYGAIQQSLRSTKKTIDTLDKEMVQIETESKQVVSTTKLYITYLNDLLDKCLFDTLIKELKEKKMEDKEQEQEEKEIVKEEKEELKQLIGKCKDIIKIYQLGNELKEEYYRYMKGTQVIGIQDLLEKINQFLGDVEKFREVFKDTFKQLESDCSTIIRDENTHSEIKLIMNSDVIHNKDIMYLLEFESNHHYTANPRLSTLLNQFQNQLKEPSLKLIKNNNNNNNNIDDEEKKNEKEENDKSEEEEEYIEEFKRVNPKFNRESIKATSMNSLITQLASNNWNEIRSKQLHHIEKMEQSERQFNQQRIDKQESKLQFLNEQAEQRKQDRKLKLEEYKRKREDKRLVILARRNKDHFQLLIKILVWVFLFMTCYKLVNIITQPFYNIFHFCFPLKLSLTGGIGWMSPELCSSSDFGKSILYIIFIIIFTLSQGYIALGLLVLLASIGINFLYNDIEWMILVKQQAVYLVAYLVLVSLWWHPMISKKGFTIQLAYDFILVSILIFHISHI